MTGAGVAAGANSAYHWVTSTPSMPASRRVGTPGSSGSRSGPATARARSRPPVIQGLALKRLANMTCVRPLTVSLSAGVDPS